MSIGVHESRVDGFTKGGIRESVYMLFYRRFASPQWWSTRRVSFFMTHPRTAYELSRSQVATPVTIVALFWLLIAQYRKHLKSVLDMGAGDCRFARGGSFDSYTGIEIDNQRAILANPGENCRIIVDCVFQHQEAEYSACIGNPPYVRHHDLQSSWKETTIARLELELSIKLNKHCNLYVYFFCLALLKSRADGLIALVIPYEWVSRPAFKAVREYMQRQQWSVAVYRFQTSIFDGVMTTASITIIDKADKAGQWKYYDISPELEVTPREGITGSREPVLEYAKRGDTWALRGLSPGSQRVFTLTESERIRAGLRKTDVVPCITSLKDAPRGLRVLNKRTFNKYFVQAGAKCWLIRSNETHRSARLDAYLEAVPEAARQTSTCINRKTWFKYQPHPVPQILFSSGFTEFGPKILINSVGACAVGAVTGIHSKKKLPLRALQSYLLGINFEKRVVGHARLLKKVEVRQLNAVLNAFPNPRQDNG